MISLLLSVIVSIIGLVGEYYEFKAHSAALMGVDYELSEKWESLWKWYMWSMIAVIAGIVIVFIPVIGALTVLVGAIGLIATSIAKLVCLKRTADAFKLFLQQNS